MKNLKVLLAILPLFTIACSDDNTGDYTGKTTEIAYLNESAKKSGIGPGNSANPFDNAGSMHNEILEIIGDTDFNSQSIEEIAILIDSVSAAHPELIPLSSDYNLSGRLSEITWIVNNENAINDVLTSCTMGVSAKASFITFVNNLPLVANDPYNNIHSVIVSYEAGVLANTGFSGEDKRIILTATSIARYAAYEKKRKDKDWETNVTSIAATVSGAEQNLILGLKMALTVEIYQSNDPTL
ncbi:hypothetical protein BC749_108263 [Flavobacterium araucananum]|uniref:hypothetical protein n=1 Tax=Flavobacterium araucananum TaxID=946678 RepID=UPI000D6B3EE4|nr:hypothetical protein [Flavobacterium araucananum]PWJ97112.1 hypothetical protein BC749_108263 [Flavobacterium araucananum]